MVRYAYRNVETSNISDKNIIKITIIIRNKTGELNVCPYFITLRYKAGQSFYANKPP